MEAKQNKYVAGVNGRKVEVEAETIYQAKLKAIDALKVKTKRERDIVWVVLAEVDGQPVIHKAVD